jgi:uncharacterized membrane protein YbhN (UPF0104 family)
VRGTPLAWCWVVKLRWIVAVVGAGVLMFAMRDLDVRALLGSLRAMDPAIGVLAMVAMLAVKLGPKIARSQVLLVAECERVGCERPRLRTTARLIAASYAAGHLAWAPLGYTIRTIALRDEGLPLGAAARVQIAEQIAESIGIAAVAVIAFAIAPAAIASTWLGRVMVGGFAALAVVAAVALASPRIRALITARVAAGSLALAAAFAFASSLGDLAVLALASRAMHVDIGLAPLVVAFLAVNGAACVPITPAQLGVQEAAITIAFATAGVPAPIALGCALAYRAAHVVPLVVVGVPTLVRTWW